MRGTAASCIRQDASRPAGRVLLAGILAVVFTAACDQSFSPIEPSAVDLSIFGYLDASADTQWVRIMPVRAVILTPSGPLGAAVTLEEVGTGQIIELRDSVFHFPAPDTTIGSEGIFLHNYWTTEQIEPDATYRCLMSATQYIHLGTGSADTDVQMIPITPPGVPQGRGCPPPRIDGQQLFIVGSGEAWPRGAEYAPQSLGVPRLPSNLSNAVGYLGGVLTHLIPYGYCRIENADIADYCRLHYDSVSVRLRGTITDPLCDGHFLPDALVELRELDPEPPTKIHYNSSNSSGEYVIAALEPTKRYALSVTHGDEFQPQTDTLTFTPGAQATYDVALRRLSRCPSPY